jgi:4-hydroxybenzoyl-CoA thioesterase
MSRIYKKRWKVKFSECDMAGIVFYPRYFEMLNFVVEEWMEDLQWSFTHLHEYRREGLPTKSLECEFMAPCRVGDELEFQMTVEALGTSSITLSFSAFHNERPVLKARSVLVYVALVTPIKSIPIPVELRAAMQDYLA